MKTLGIVEFLSERENTPIIDVRSPAEFAKGHIFGAINLPLFTNEERTIVGTKYIQESRYDSVVAGLDFVGPKLKGFVEEVAKISPNKKILVYCWRGGMRSASMAWLLNLAGFHSKTLIGGYRSYRRHIKETLTQPLKLIILGGMTGSGKTDLLTQLSKLNQQVIDLEGLANHKGSAFGAIGQKPQPTTEFFENLMFEDLIKVDPTKPIWVEDESKGIGSVFISDEFYNQMLNSPVIAIEIPFEVRVKKLAKDYTNCNPELLIASVNKITKRLGSDNAVKAVKYIEDGQFEEAIEITLKYYDKAYRFGLSNKKTKTIFCNLPFTDPIQNCELLIEKAKELY